MYARRHSDLLLSLLDRLHCFSQRFAGRQIERDSRCRELPLMVDGKRRARASERSKGAQRNIGSVRRMHIDVFERIWSTLKVRPDLKHNVILVQLREHGGDLSLAEGVVEGVVDRLRLYAQARGGVTVDVESSLQTAALLVTSNVAELRDLPELVHQLRGERVQLVQVRVFQRVLVLRAADAVLNRQVLNRLHVERDAFNLLQIGLEPLNDLGG